MDMLPLLLNSDDHYQLSSTMMVPPMMGDLEGDILIYVLNLIDLLMMSADFFLFVGFDGWHYF